MTQYVVEQEKDGRWHRIPKLHEFYAMAEIAASLIPGKTRIVPINEAIP